MGVKVVLLHPRLPEKRALPLLREWREKVYKTYRKGHFMWPGGIAGRGYTPPGSNIARWEPYRFQVAATGDDVLVAITWAENLYHVRTFRTEVWCETPEWEEEVRNLVRAWVDEESLL